MRRGCNYLALTLARVRRVRLCVGARYIIPTSVMASLDFYTDFNPWYQARITAAVCRLSVERVPTRAAGA